MLSLKIRAYWQLMRFHRPVGIFLLLWPTLWALWLAHSGWPEARLLAVFVLGVIVTRAGGCIANDYADRRFDGHVQRTQHRPLATGALSSRQALWALLALGLIALSLVSFLSRLCFYLSLLAAGLTLLYPYLKRYTYFPQVVLGFAFAMPVPMAFAATVNHLPPLCAWLFLVSVIWPLMYDTAYAITDQQDDAKLGLKSTALWFGRYSWLFIAVLQVAFIGLWIYIGVTQHLQLPFWLALAISAALFLYQQTLLHRQQAFAAFTNNQWLGGIIWLGLVLSMPS